MKNIGIGDFDSEQVKYEEISYLKLKFTNAYSALGIQFESIFYPHDVSFMV